MVDLIQKYGKKLNKPQIRVWCHPKNGKDDFWYVFRNVVEARKFIKDNSKNKRFFVEELPLIAYKGFELTINQFNKKYPKVKI